MTKYFFPRSSDLVVEMKDYVEYHGDNKVGIYVNWAIES
jgi:hypothetical protein